MILIFVSIESFSMTDICLNDSGKRNPCFESFPSNNNRSCINKPDINGNSVLYREIVYTF